MHFWKEVFASVFAFSMVCLPLEVTYGTVLSSAVSSAQSVQQARQSVWKFTIPEEGISLGSGFFISPNRIVTAAHIIEEPLTNGELSRVELIHEDHNFRLKVKRLVFLSDSPDLALLETTRPAPSFLPLKPSPAVATETGLSVWGYPSYPKGALLRMKQIGALLISENIFFPVNKIYLAETSGSPVLDAQGRVAGVVFIAYDNMVGAIGLKVLRDFIEGKRGVVCKAGYARECFHTAQALLQKQAVDQDQAHAQYKLGFRHFYGIGRTKNKKTAEILWKRAAEQGYLLAQYDVSITYLENYDPTGIYWLEQLAGRGFAPALYSLGDLYEKGSYGEINEELSAHFTLRAARKGFALAVGLASGFYFEGVGVEKNINKAYYWLDFSIEIDKLDFN